MPRIRTIKPEFWTDGAITDLSMAARLLFIGSWNFALCDRGHVADDPRRLKMQVLPADDVDAEALVEEIIAAGRMDRIAAPDGRSFLHIRRFTDHQKIEKRWNPRCPACDSLGLNEPRPTSPNLSAPRASSRDLPESRATSAQEGKGKERNKDSSSKIASDLDEEPRPEVIELCDHLADWIEKNGSKRPQPSKRWHRACRLLLDVDGKTPDQVRKAIDWCQQDEFWRSNVLSMHTLREKYDQLRLKAAQKKTDRSHLQAVPSYETPPAPDRDQLPWDGPA